MSIYNPKTNKDLRSNAKGQLIGKYGAAIFIGLTVTMIELIITSISDKAYTGSTGSYLLRFAITIIVDLLMGILFYGQARFFLNLVRGKEPLVASDLFYGFKHNMDKAVVIQAVFTGASLVASIPAVLVSLNLVALPADYAREAELAIYALDIILVFIVKLFFGLSFYILNDNPDMTVSEVLKESMRLMENKKGRYFMLCLSMIPLCIVSVFAFIVGVLWFVAYYQVVLTNFYLDTIEEEPFNPSVDREPTPQPDDHFDYSI